MNWTKFFKHFTAFQETCYQVSADHGFHEKDGQTPDEFMIPLRLGLIHGEVAEALESFRKNGLDAPSEHGLDGSVTALEEELADIVIRVADMAETHGLDLASAIQEKVEYNKTRPYKHGKNF